MLIGLWTAWALGAGAPAAATPPAGTCFAVSTVMLEEVPATVRCGGTPSGYQQGSLWLRLPMPPRPAGGAMTLMVHSTRFARLRVRFVYADSVALSQEVRRGAFGSHWHVDGQIGFPAPLRPAPLVAVWMRFDRLVSYDLVRVRLVPGVRLARQLEFGAVLLGAAVALLATGALYALVLGVATRRQYLLWHGLWALAVLCWGLVWSQAVLVRWPTLAGTTASMLATILACLAILFAAMSALAALTGNLGRWARYAVGGPALAVVMLGIAADLPGVPITVIGDLLAAATLATLVAVAVCLFLAWRRGHDGARDLALAWALPMVALGLTQLVDLDTALLGGGAQLAVLFASAFQTLAVSVLATVRLNRLRIERDQAIAAHAMLTDLAERDPLTGLLNRQGFVTRCEAAFGALADVPFGLFLIDVDQFKSVNDGFGHEAGDAVLVAIAATLRAFETRCRCLSGRLGGEEFVVGISGLLPASLARLAEEIRIAVAACDHGPLCGQRRVTVSIGVAMGAASGPFRTLYGRADRALYEAKRDGRDRVVVEPRAGGDPESQLVLPLPPQRVA